jgi:hypothetical protein
MNLSSLRAYDARSISLLFFRPLQTLSLSPDLPINSLLSLLYTLNLVHMVVDAMEVHMPSTCVRTEVLRG